MHDFMTEMGLNQAAPWQKRAVLNFVFEGEDPRRVLLIHKLRGFGKGKINGPGGKIEPGESAADAAIRETLEEVCLECYEPAWRGRIGFHFTDGLSLLCDVFVSVSFAGTPARTDEADPFWCPVEHIPWDSMWADDRYWLPHILRGNFVEAHFEFDGDTMLDGAIKVGTDEAQLSTIPLVRLTHLAATNK